MTSTARRRIVRRRQRGPTTSRYHRLLAIESLLTMILMTTTKTAAAIGADNTAVTIITCKTAGGRMVEIPPSRINDGYCDCWETGEDETTTDACAGVDYWGWALTSYGPDDADQIERPHFICQQQPDQARLAFSRVQDGICDCCDGSDEAPIKMDCPNTCAKLVAAALAERTALTERYTKGSATRRAAIDAFRKEKAESTLELETLQAQLTNEQANLEMNSAAFSAAKLEFAQQRLDRIARAAADDDLVDGLTTDIEWKQFIIHACQLSGEMSTDGSDCEALHLAGLDAGLGLTATLQSADLANLLYHNANNDADDRIWNVADLPKTSAQKMKKKKRRLMRVAAAEEYAFDDDDRDDNDDHRSDDDDHHHDSSGNVDQETSDERAAMEQLPFSESRVAFLIQASRLLKLINEASVHRQEEPKTDEELQNVGQEDAVRRAKVKELVAMEDKAFDLLRETLTNRKRLIDRGFDYALSAQAALEGVADAATLRRLALGIVYHGKLSAIHVYQILESMLFEEDAVDTQSCPNMVARVCPPKTTVRGNDTIPSKIVIDAVESFCNNGADLTSRQASCIDSDDAIPNEILDGFAGYYETFPRDECDQWQKRLDATFALTEEESTKLVDIAEKDGYAEAARKKIKELEKKMNDLKESIGADDEDKYGPEGELYSIRDECFSVKNGKYTYELCMYKRASQKDGGSSTDLGTWIEAAVETIEDREEHVWKWDRGARCWNGPTRSATAYVTCGIATLVLSADEPDTCRYVFQVQSPMACDDAFKTRHGL